MAYILTGSFFLALVETGRLGGRWLSQSRWEGVTAGLGQEGQTVELAVLWCPAGSRAVLLRCQALLSGVLGLGFLSDRVEMSTRQLGMRVWGSLCEHVVLDPCEQGGPCSACPETLILNALGPVASLSPKPAITEDHSLSHASVPCSHLRGYLFT